MPKQTNLERAADAEISRLKKNVIRLKEQIFKQEAEIKAYENMKEWSKNVRTNKTKQSSTNTK